MVVVQKGNTQRMSPDFDMSCFGAIAELSCALIVKEQNLIAGADGYVGFSVVIVVTGRATYSIPKTLESRALGRVLKGSLAAIEIERHMSAAVWNQHVGQAIAVQIKDANPRTGHLRTRCLLLS